MPKSDGFLLDTHLWIWLLNGDSLIQKPTVFSLIITASRKNALYISAISIWEVAMLEAKGCITFSTDITSWINDAVSAPGLQVVQLLPDISIDSTHLPGQFHGDPADRKIVATARFLKCPLITMDGKILVYAKKGFLDAVSL
jgi:PIN domain nuclease of toxin-antitoxin system